MSDNQLVGLAEDFFQNSLFLTGLGKMEMSSNTLLGWSVLICTLMICPHIIDL